MKSKKLLSDEKLEWSTVVANNTMNRERQAFGVNSYAKDIRLNPIKFIEQYQRDSTIHWLDLCCGSGKALIQAAEYFKENNIKNYNLKLKGYDLVDFFDPYEANPTLELKQLNLSYWKPSQKYHLITIVHGLHYIGDKLGLIEKAISALQPDGIFIANLDLENIVFQGDPSSKIELKKLFKDFELDYNPKIKIVQTSGPKQIEFPFQYLGADDQAGPNYTGQPVVNSVYINSKIT